MRNWSGALGLGLVCRGGAGAGSCRVGRRSQAVVCGPCARWGRGCHVGACSQRVAADWSKGGGTHADWDGAKAAVHTQLCLLGFALLRGIVPWFCTTCHLAHSGAWLGLLKFSLVSVNASLLSA